MGMIMEYMMIDKDAKKPDIEEIWELSEELEDDRVFDMDKLWDLVHTALVGKGTFAVDESLRSKAVMGNEFYEDADMFAAYTDYDCVKEIYQELKNIDLEKLKENFELENFCDEKVYLSVIFQRAGGDQEEIESLYNEIIDAITELTEFYKKAVDEQCAVIANMC